MKEFNFIEDKMVEDNNGKKITIVHTIKICGIKVYDERKEIDYGK